MLIRRVSSASSLLVVSLHDTFPKGESREGYALSGRGLGDTPKPLLIPKIQRLIVLANDWAITHAIAD